MEINYVFPHPIATVHMNALDNKKIHDTIEKHAVGKARRNQVQEFGS